MKKELSVFRRGQVWYIDDKLKAEGNLQGKSRPYLVVSNDDANANSPLLHIAPITKQNHNDWLPTHVQVFDPYRNFVQTVLIEQTKVVNIASIIPVATYKYSLTKAKMDEVDMALAAQFGIPYCGASLQEFERILNAIVESKLAEVREKIQAESNRATATNSITQKFIESIDSLTAEIPVDEESDTQDIVDSSDTESHEEAEDLHESENVEESVEATSAKQDDNPESSGNTDKPERSKRSKWTDDLKRQFVADVYSMPKNEVMTKYRMTSSTFYTLSSKYKREVALMDKSNQDIDNNSEEQKDNYPAGTDSYSKYKAEVFLRDYDSKPISEVMKLYNLPDKKSVVEKATQYSNLLGR